MGRADEKEGRRLTGARGVVNRPASAVVSVDGVLPSEYTGRT